LLLPFELRRIPGVAKTSPSPAGNQGLLQNTPKNTLPPGKLAIGATWRLLLPHLNQYGFTYPAANRTRLEKEARA